MFSKTSSAFKINFRPIVVIFLSLLFGIICARKLYAADVFYVVLTVLALGSVVIYGLLKKRYVFMLLALIFFFGGNGIYFLSYNSFLGREYENAQISGRVTDNITVGESYYSLVLEDVTADGDRVGNIQLYVWSPSEEIRVGDILTFTSDLENVKLFTMGSFNTYALRSKIAYSSSVQGSELSLVSGGKTFDETAREKIKEVLFENMDEQNAGVAYAVLTGDQSYVTTEIDDAYRFSGIIHLLTVSGLHVTFLIGLIAWVMKKCRVNRFVNFGLTLCLLLLYAYICGFAPSILRAMIMGLFLIAAGLFGRRYDGLSALSAAGILTLIISPLSALDVGFLMSYVCVGAIFVLQRPFANFFKKFLPDKVADLIALSFATQIGILPFLASFYSSLNLLSFFTNLIVVPFFGVLFPLLIVLVLLVMVIPVFGPVLIVPELGFEAIRIVAEFFASTDLMISLRSLDPITITLVYLICLVVSYFFMSSTRLKYALVLCLTMVLGLFTLISPELYVRGPSISIINYYGSYNAVLESSSGQTLCLGSPAFRVNYFYSARGIDNFDCVLSSNVRIDGAEMVSSGEGYVGDFAYSTDGKNFIIEFDGLKIFFTNDERISYNESVELAQILSENEFDFVFICDYDFSGYSNFVSASAGADSNANYCTQNLGNFTYSFDKNYAWGID